MASELEPPQTGAPGDRSHRHLAGAGDRPIAWALAATGGVPEEMRRPLADT